MINISSLTNQVLAKNIKAERVAFDLPLSSSHRLRGRSKSRGKEKDDEDGKEKKGSLWKGVRKGGKKEREDDKRHREEDDKRQREEQEIEEKEKGSDSEGGGKGANIEKAESIEGSECNKKKVETDGNKTEEVKERRRVQDSEDVRRTEVNNPNITHDSQDEQDETDESDLNCKVEDFEKEAFITFNGLVKSFSTMDEMMKNNKDGATAVVAVLSASLHKIFVANVGDAR